MSSLRESCEAVLRGNDRDGRYTVPSPRLYPHQWAWDSAFAAIGWATFEPQRAWTELETLMAGQWDDGRVPHIQFHDLSGDYFPGPGFWGTERSSSITQPPVWASAARRVVEIAGLDEQRLRRLLPRFEASHRFFAEQRDPLDWGLCAVVHPWESGLDNCPVWDGPLSRVDKSRAPSFERRDTLIAGDVDVRPSDEHYRGYAALVKSIADDGFGPGPFAVYDPLMSAILIRAEDDLQWLAAQCGATSDASTRAASMRAALCKRLYDEEKQRFNYYDARTREVIDVDVIGGYLPLWCNVAAPIAEALRQSLAERFTCTWPLPSTSPSDPAFEARRYWRGPCWININWMLAEQLGPDLRRRSLQLIERSGIREYYSPESGEGLGADNFSWSAALALDMLRRDGH